MRLLAHVRTSHAHFRFACEILAHVGAQEVKHQKKAKMKDIIHSMEQFNQNLQGGKRLIASLEGVN